MSGEYPVLPAARSRWVMQHRPEGRLGHGDEKRVQAAFLEEEPLLDGRRALIHTLFLTNRECPWRCVMCDLWRHTLHHSVSPGSIPRQMDDALAELGRWPRPETWRSRGLDSVRQLKLYNSGSFFDLGAVPEQDYDEIAARCVGYERVIVECHPRLVNEKVLRFQEKLAQAAGQGGPRLEVALGLETAHPQILDRLNKRITVEDFRQAARRLKQWGVSVRVFLLVGLPWLNRQEWNEWATRSMEVVLEEQAEVISWIPLRLGPGALEILAGQAAVSQPDLASLEWHQEAGLQAARGRARIFADVWDLERFSSCSLCFEPRKNRLIRMNQTQQCESRIECDVCSRGGGRGD